MAARRVVNDEVEAGFVPAVTFLGFPDGVTDTWYYAGKQESAPKEYVDILRAKGLLMPDAVAAIDDESEEK